MPLALDLSASEAKIERAREHLESLQREARAFVEDGNAYTVRVTPIDKDGWSDALIRSHDAPKYAFGTIVGDLIHNLRSALDYIVTALVDASPPATLTTQHQFPIFETEVGYKARVGTKHSALPNGRLGNVRFGLEEIWELQPFHRKPSPIHDPLWAIAKLSNADKHRTLPVFAPLIQSGEGEWFIERGAFLRNVTLPPLADWQPNQEHHVGRVQIVGAHGAQPYYRANLTLDVHVSLAAFPGQHPAFSFKAGELLIFCNYVAKIVNLFKQL